MAIFHLSCNNISRGKGQSAIAAAAYRSGDELYSERYGKKNSYFREVSPESFILKPKHAPDWTLDREKLWNEVEKVEKPKNSRLAKHFDIALPVELSNKDQRELTLEFCQENFVDEGMVADISIHRDDEKNPHFHVMLTTRPFNEDGSWGSKSKKEYILDTDGNFTYTKSGQKRSRKIEPVDWNTKERLNIWRKNWAEKANKYLEKNKVNIRISEKSYEDTGIDKKPTIHEGYVAREMGERSERIQHNIRVKKFNEAQTKITEYKNEIGKVNEVNKLTRNLSPNEKKELASISKELKTFVNFDYVQRKLTQLSYWERSENFKQDFGHENVENLTKINNQKELISKANSILTKDADRFINKHYKELSSDLNLTDFQKQFITDLSIGKNKVLSKEEFVDSVDFSAHKEFYDSIKKITRDSFKSHQDLKKSLIKHQEKFNYLVSENQVDFKDKKTIERLSPEKLSEIKTATLRVNNTKKALEFLENYYEENIKEMYPDHGELLNQKMPIHEKEIVVASYEYYNRVLDFKEIKNIKVDPPSKYSDLEKESVLQLIKQFNSLNNPDQKRDVKEKVYQAFPEIFGEYAKPGVEQLFYSELSSYSERSKSDVDTFIDELSDSNYRDPSSEYYSMFNSRKTGPIGSLLSSGYKTISGSINEMDYAERDKINEMNRLQDKISRRNRRDSGLQR